MGPAVQPPPPPRSRAVFESTPPPSERRFLPWAATARDVILVDKASRTLELYRYGELLKRYPVVLGRSGGRKRFEGDRRTPSGLYRITGKRRHWRFEQFLDLSYPNAEDLAHYRLAASRGQVPRMPSGRSAGPGSLLGIHGTDKDDLNVLGVDWTLGCVSLRNHDVTDLASLVEPGTLVVIRGTAAERVTSEAVAPVASH
jgi:murein L,D-transpeptidase YafK